jgi:hypothetical protein
MFGCIEIRLADPKRDPAAFDLAHLTRYLQNADAAFFQLEL